MDKCKAWEFAIGLQAVDDKTVSPELMELAEREISGEITTAEVIERLRKKYREGDTHGERRDCIIVKTGL